MLKLRRGRVASVGHSDARIARIAVELEFGEGTREAVAYPALTGPVSVGDEVVVNIEAQDLGLGSGGFDIVCANLTRGLAHGVDPGTHVMKLNYTPLQHAVRPVEEGLEDLPGAIAMPVAVLALHGQLAPAAFALSQRAPGARVGYVQTPGGALAGALSDAAATLLDRGLVSGHVTVAPCFGGAYEAMTAEGALHAGVARLGWDAALIGPGPGIIGSASALGHGGLSALHNAHAAQALGCPIVLAARISSADPRPRHRGLSHHTRTVLELLLRPAEVAVPGGLSRAVAADLRAALKAGKGHAAVEVAVEDLMESYLKTGLPSETMGRSIREEPDFFRAALGAGAALATKLPPPSQDG